MTNSGAPARLRPASERIAFHEGSAEHLPLETAVADVVDSFDHWTDKREGMREVRRVLRSGGRLVVVKDGGVPGGTQARQAFTGILSNAGFDIATEQVIEEAGVSFILWECSVRA